jgi:toxin ParE1/3/4
MKQYAIAKAASQDLDEILEYFLTLNIEAGERFVQLFNRKCQNLVQFPKIGRIYDHIAPSLRGVPLNGYIIFYRIVDDGLIIVRVVSGYRNLKSVFSEPSME